MVGTPRPLIRAPMTPTASYVLQTFVTLGAVCVLAVVVLVGVRKLSGNRTFGGLTLVGHLPLDARRAVYLVGAGEQVWVIGVSEAGLVKLGELKRAELLQASPPPTTSPFAEVFTRLTRTSPRAAATGGNDSDNRTSPSAHPSPAQAPEDSAT
jgi:flagellar biogenesis protein FliO